MCGATFFFRKPGPDGIKAAQPKVKVVGAGLYGVDERWRPSQSSLDCWMRLLCVELRGSAVMRISHASLCTSRGRADKAHLVVSTSVWSDLAVELAGQFDAWRWCRASEAVWCILGDVS